MRQKQDLRSLHTESEIFTYVLLFFSYSSSFPIKMNATDAKPQKIEPDSIFFFDGRKFRRQCANVIDSDLQNPDLPLIGAHVS